ARSPSTTSRSSGASNSAAASMHSQPTPETPPRRFTRHHPAHGYAGSLPPHSAAAYPNHSLIELFCCADTLACHFHHALGSPAALLCRSAHPCFDQPLGLQSVKRGVKGAKRTGTPARGLDHLAHRCSVGLFAQMRRRGKNEVFKFADHN